MANGMPMHAHQWNQSSFTRFTSLPCVCTDYALEAGNPGCRCERVSVRVAPA